MPEIAQASAAVIAVLLILKTVFDFLDKWKKGRASDAPSAPAAPSDAKVDAARAVWEARVCDALERVEKGFESTVELQRELVLELRSMRVQHDERHDAVLDELRAVRGKLSEPRMPPLRGGRGGGE